MVNQLVWPHLVRPAVPLLYLDLNHFINLARARQSLEPVARGYAELWQSLSIAVRTGRVLVPLSAQHVCRRGQVELGVEVAQTFRLAPACNELRFAI